MESKRQRRQQTKQQKSEVKLHSDHISCIISCILHCIFFLILTLIYNSSHKTKIPIPIVIDFVAESHHTIDLQPVEIDLPEQPELVDSSDSISSAGLIENIAEDVSLDIEFIDTISVSNRNDTNIPDINDLNATIASNTNQTPLDHDMDVNSGNNKSNRVLNGRGSGIGNTEMDRRLQAAGAKTGDIQVSISWNNYNDIDVWLEFKEGKNNYALINWMNRSVGHGFLDVDMNYKPHTNTPVENIYWAEGEAPFGTYTVYLQNYHQWEERTDSTWVDLRIIIDGKIINKKCNIKTKDGIIKVFTINRKPTKEILAKRAEREKMKDLYGPNTYGAFGYTPDDIVIQPVPTFR